MRRFVRLVSAIAFSAALCAAASAENKAYDDSKYDYDIFVSQIKSARAPYIQDGKVVFTADSKTRFTGIAFDFENFREIHPFSVRRIRDIEGNEISSCKFYVLDAPKELTSVQYRLVVDGLWTTDPLNPNSGYDPRTGTRLSRIELDRVIEPATEVIAPEGESPRVRFVCRTNPGQKVRIGGSFTNWDSWIYELEEVRPGVYQLDLPLASGTWFYSYYTGISAFVDETNPERAYTPDGRMASVITVR